MKNIYLKDNRKVAIATLGCKVNQYESASFLNSLEDRGMTVVPFSKPADIYIINTCAVTAKAGAQSRQQIRRALRQNPEARIIVTGCYSQVASLDVLDLAEKSICIVGNGYKDKLVYIATSASQCDLEMHMGDIGLKKEICDLPVRKFEGRTRAYLKIQDGCNRFCSYCIVPYARGRSRSLPPEKVLAQAQEFAREGYHELVITGIHAGTYGQDLESPTDMFSIIKQLLELDLPLRYRLSSLEPTEISDDFLQLMKTADNFMPHLHIPLQSGDDRILRKMNRRYTSGLFSDTIEKCVAFMPDVSIGVDVLVGFPGEDEKAFNNTYKLLERLPVAYLHVFPYSRRPGTVAAGMPDQVAGPVKEERVKKLRALDAQKRRAFYERQIGTTRRVLVESRKSKNQLLKGFTDNYLPVYFAGADALINSIVDVTIERLDEGEVFGSLLLPNKQGDITDHAG
jgi:threonylcarbamoyladenosine tRNA methylthiotransferase MtaB